MTTKNATSKKNGRSTKNTTSKAPKAPKTTSADVQAQLDKLGADVQAPDVAPAPVAPQAPVTSEAPAPVQTSKGAEALLLTSANATHDVLKGRVGARTHALHIALVEAHLAGAPISTKQATARASAIMSEKNYASHVCNATNSHLNTMQTRKFVVRVNGAWALSADALALLVK